MLERLNEETKRRTHVVRIFPNRESCLRWCGRLPSKPTKTGSSSIGYLNMDDLRERKKEALRRAA